MNLFIPIVLVMCFYLPESDSAGLAGKSLVFSKKTATDYVSLNASAFSSMSAFTVCLRAASEENHDYSLLSYATTSSNNELLIWQKNNGQLTLFLGAIVAQFFIPKMNAILRHTCVTWESQRGLITVWVNGKRSLHKVGGKGKVVNGSGQFVLGQEQDEVGGKFDANQSFVGEMTDVNLWNYVLKPNEIEMISQGCFSAGGNIIDWRSTGFQPVGNVKIEDNNDCKL